MTRIKLIDLYEKVHLALVDLGVSEHALYKYRYHGFSPLKRYFAQNNKVYYSRKFVDECVLDAENARKSNSVPTCRHQCIRKVAVMLDEYEKTGSITWTRLPYYNATRLVCKHFETVLTHYLMDLSSKGRCSSLNIPNIKSILKQFLHYIEDQGYRNFSCLTRKIISNYLPVVAKKRPGSMANVIAYLKSFLDYLHENKLIVSELVSTLPRYPQKQQKHFDGLTREAAKALISSIPFETNHGKRSIAMFTLAESTGLRGVDVVNLKLCDIDWRNKTISIIQHKTKRPLMLPLENHVGDALASYILHDRPKSEFPFVFLTAIRPFRPLNAKTASSSASRSMERCGIENSPSFRKGFHVFRGIVGTWLLEAELPLTMISEVLGHGHIDSTKPYLSTDHARLRECAIGLEGIEIREGVFQW